jgi:uncharacterized protein YcbK (DUF882 family)
MRRVYAHFSDADDWSWANFTPREMACKGTGRLVVETEFLDRLQMLRTMFDRPLIVNSGYRTPEYNVKVSKTWLDGPHTTARAVDVRVYGSHAAELIALAQGLGFTGIGVSQGASTPFAQRFLHLDDLPVGGRHPRPWIWSY